MKKLIAPALAAGIAGGIAEVLWVALYSTATSTSGVEVARQVTATVMPYAAAEQWAPAAGVGIHVALSLALGLAFVLFLWGFYSRRPRAGEIWTAALLTVVVIWAANFLVILPALGSGFGTLMPLGATLLSKALFGIAMAAVLHRTAAWTPRRELR